MSDELLFIVHRSSLIAHGFMSNFSFSLNHHLELPDDVFRLLRDQIYRRSGIWFNDTSKYLLQKRLSPRASG